MLFRLNRLILTTKVSVDTALGTAALVVKRKSDNAFLIPHQGDQISKDINVAINAFKIKHQNTLVEKTCGYYRNELKAVEQWQELKRVNTTTTNGELWLVFCLDSHKDTFHACSLEFLNEDGGVRTSDCWGFDSLKPPVVIPSQYDRGALQRVLNGTESTGAPAARMTVRP